MDGAIENINLYKLKIFFHNLKPKESPKKKKEKGYIE
jgi:hypothetical protein